jgi:sarcosine oxidase
VPPGAARATGPGPRAVHSGPRPGVGSSHGGARIIRLAYFEDPAYVPLLLRAYELWRRPERDPEADLLLQTAGLMLGRAASPAVAGALRSARE